MRILNKIDLSEVENLQIKIDELQLKVRELKNQQRELLELKSKEYFNGCSNMSEFISSDDEKRKNIQISDDITISIWDSSMYGKYKFDGGTLHVSGSIYYYDSVFRPRICYDNGRTLNSLPKKYENMYEILVDEMKKNKIYNPLKKYFDKL